MFAKFKEHRFNDSSAEIIDQAADICTEYESLGFTITLRQLYYQFVARGLLDNNQKNYKRLGSIVNDARLAGELDWDWLEDRTRNLSAPATWSSPKQIIDACVSSYQIDKQNTQPVYVEVWVEKEALAGIIGDVADTLEVPHFACRGYPSSSELFAAGQRFRHRLATTEARSVCVIHLGDHDPSGIDMTRDIEERVGMFMDTRSWQLDVRRIALNYDQIRRFNPPPNPAKTTDSRFDGYASKFGTQSWELDALNPTTLADLIRSEVLSVRDLDAWEEAALKEKHERDHIELARDYIAKIKRDYE